MKCPDCGFEMEHHPLVDGTDWYECEECLVVIQRRGPRKEIRDKEGPSMALRTVITPNHLEGYKHE